MKRIIILVPVFNDWESLKRLLQEINKNIKNFKNIVVDCFIVNDASTIKQPKMEKPDLINLIKIFLRTAIGLLKGRNYWLTIWIKN